MRLFKSILAKLYRDKWIDIDSCPITITKPGKYRLKHNITMIDPTLSAIRINSNNVMIDMQGHTIEASECCESKVCGIESYGHSHILIKNGTTRKFMYGIRIQDNNMDKLANNSSDAMQHIYVFNVDCESSTFRGVLIQAKYSLVAESRFKNIGGTSAFPDSFAMGIEMCGQGNFISNNIINNVYPVGIGEGVGISISAYGDGSQVIGNNIANDAVTMLGRSFGIWVGDCKDNDIKVTHNTFSNLSYGIGKNNLDYKAYNNIYYNRFINIRCAQFFGMPRAYYLDKNPSFEEDTHYIQKKADEGISKYLYKLGMQYLEGLWVDKDINQAFEYFKRAAYLGHEESIRMLSKQH